MSEADYVAGNPPFNGTDLMVVVSGCSGGGKSTLLAEMALRGYHVHPEPGRQIVKEQLHIGGDGLPWENAVKFAELCVKKLFSSDAERRHSFEEAEAEFAALLKIYKANAYEVVLIPKGTTSERASFLERQLGY